VEARAVNDEFESFEGWSKGRSKGWSRANYSGCSVLELIPERAAY
jgi:hypothetical protein